MQSNQAKIKYTAKMINPAGNFCVWDTTVTFEFPSSAGYEESGIGNMVYYFSSPSPVQEPEEFVFIFNMTLH